MRSGIRTIKTNVLGTLNMLGMAKRLKARFLISSTSEVYGDPEIHPQVEEYWGNVNPIGIRSCYDEGKRIAETLCFEYYRMHKVDIRVARIFNVHYTQTHTTHTPANLYSEPSPSGRPSRSPRVSVPFLLAAVW